MNAPYSLIERRAAKLTVADFLLLDRSGAFDRYAKTELINGTIVVVNAQFSAHMKAKVRLLRRFADACDALGGGLQAWSEGSIDMSPDSLPEPDVFVTDIEPTGDLIAAKSVVLIAEVADSTVRDDLGEKADLYAAHGVPEYWVVDLPHRTVHRRWTPRPDGYGDGAKTALGERMASATVAGLAVETDGLI